MLQKSLTPRARRVAVWIATAAVAACAVARDVVTTIDVGSVSITPPATTVSVGSQIPLQALVQDPSGKTITPTEIHWSVENPSIATISNTGVVTGVALGSTQVAASVNGKSGIATITVEKTPVASVVVTPPHVDAAPGGQAQLSATAYDAGQNPLSGRAITWSTSSAAVATVDANGMMTAVSTGSATITATSEGKNGVATISVAQAAVATVTVTPSPLAMSVGQQTQLTATLKDAGGTVLNGRAVTWSSSNTGVATVSSQGFVTAVAVGATTVTATSEGTSGTAALTISNVAVGSVTVQPQGPSIVQGSNVQLSAIVRDVNGNAVTDRVVTWSSSNTGVAGVSSTGIVTGVSAGSATITATSEGKSGTSTVTVTPLPVGSVTVAPTTATVVVGSTTTLAATVKDLNGTVVTNRVVTWASSSPGVATVNGGVVTGVAAGTATITATSEGKSGSATVTVTQAPVATVIVQPNHDSLGVGTTVQLTAITEDAAGNVLTGRTVTWGSSNGTVATVSTTGLVTTQALGTATITATSEGKSGTSAITVYIPVATVLVAPTSATIFPTQTKQFAATTKDAQGSVLTGRLVTWSSSNPAVATVNFSSGLATAVAVGSATITATSEGKSGSATLTVNPVPVRTVTITPPSPDTVFIGYTTQLSAVTKDSAGGILTGRVVTWQLNNPSLATLTPIGSGALLTVTGVALGNTPIVATSEGKSATNTLVSMKAPVGTVTVAPNADSVTTSGAASSKLITATITDVNGTVVTDRVVSWTSVPGAVATVSPPSGPSTTVTGKNVGSALVIAASETKADTANIKVILAATSVTISPPTAALSLTTTKTVQLTATTKNGSTTITGRTITWSSSAPAVASVDATTGLVTAVSVGTAQITARIVLDGVNSAVPASITVTP